MLPLSVLLVFANACYACDDTSSNSVHASNADQHDFSNSCRNTCAKSKGNQEAESCSVGSIPLGIPTATSNPADRKEPSKSKKGSWTQDLELQPRYGPPIPCHASLLRARQLGLKFGTLVNSYSADSDMYVYWRTITTLLVPE